MFSLILIESAFTQNITNILNRMSWHPKENKELYNKNSGLLKLRNQYSNRVFVVSTYSINQNYYQSLNNRIYFSKYNQSNFWWKKRETVKFAFNYRSYCTDSTPKGIIEKLNNLNNKARKRSNLAIDSNLFSLISNLEILKLAYENLKSKPGIKHKYTNAQIHKYTTTYTNTQQKKAIKSNKK
jgi:uncharacterized protein (UPF0248 family)